MATRYGFTCGAFDLLHPGHIHLLKTAKDWCDHLTVGLHTNPTIDRPQTKNIPVQTSFERWMQLQSVKYIDTIIPYDTELDLNNMLAVLPITHRFVGEEYRSLTLTGQDICETKNITIIYIPRLHSYSSSHLRQRVEKRYTDIGSASTCKKEV